MKPVDSNSSMNEENVESIDSLHFRGLLLKLQDRLSDDDRKRLHFYLANDIPRRIRDDPTLGGTLSLLESLFDQDKINAQDFTFLIKAFNEIQCFDAVRLLQDYMRRLQSNELHKSIQSLAVIMPTWADQLFHDQDDTDSVYFPLKEPRTVINKNTKYKEVNGSVNNLTKSSLTSKQKELFHLSSITQKCFLCLIFLSIILLGVIIGCSIWITQLKMQYSVLHHSTMNNENTLKLMQARYHELIEDVMKKMGQVIVKRLRIVEKDCLDKSSFDSSDPTVPISVDLSPTFIEDLACIKACYHCVDENLFFSHTNKSMDKCGPLCNCADACAVMPIEDIDKLYSQQNYTSDKGCLMKIYTQSLKNNDLFSIT